MKIKNILYLFILTAIVFSCKSKQQIVKVQPENKLLSELIQKVQNAEPKFTTANISKMSADITLNGRSFNVNANCKIKTDSAIHISIVPFGFEMFKLEINKDSILAFDKMNKKLYATDFKFFENKFGVAMDFNNLQAMFSNQYFNIGKDDLQLENTSFKKNENTEYQIDFASDKMLQTNVINDLNRIVKIDFVSKKNNYKMQTLYTDFIQMDRLMFPQKINLLATSGQKEFKCAFNISKVVFNNNLTFSNQDKSRFTRANINQFFNK